MKTVYFKRRNDTKEWVDVYCCRNPFCDKRMRIVSHGDSVPVHCQIPACFINSMHKLRWDEIAYETTRLVGELRGRILSARILREREQEEMKRSA